MRVSNLSDVFGACSGDSNTREQRCAYVGIGQNQRRNADKHQRHAAVVELAGGPGLGDGA
eukprot:COSAG01_NODE_43505_length_429_cov_0.781818_1_plen_59_part_10